MNKLNRLLALAAVSATAAVCSRASTYATINVDGDGSDWTGIAASYTGPSGGTVNINQVFVANDSDYLYLRVQFVSSVNPQLDSGLSLSIDTDNTLGTGFPIWGYLGAEISWSNDSAFDQRSGGWNDGWVSSANAAIGLYNSFITEQEYRISLSATFLDSTNVFPALGSTITLMFWSETGDDMATGPFTYTLASVPEPSTFAALAGLGVLGLVAARRRR